MSIAKRFTTAALLFSCARLLNAQVSPTPTAVFSNAEPPSFVRFDTPQDGAPKSRRAPLFAPLASLVLPGSGQAMLRQQRSVGYLAAEGFLVLRALRARRDANQARIAYRSIADVARANFGTVRPVGPWDYYETVEEFDASGAYDLQVGGKFTPETDAATYNGAKWLQARETYWVDADTPPAESSAEYQRALEFYRARAVQGSFRWSWHDHNLEQTAYLQTIKEANSRKQQYVSDIGLVAANHLISMVDAYINLRLRRFGGAGLAPNLRMQLQPVGNPREGQIGSSLTISMPLRLR